MWGRVILWQVWGLQTESQTPSHCDDSQYNSLLHLTFICLRGHKLLCNCTGWLLVTGLKHSYLCVCVFKRTLWSSCSLQSPWKQSQTFCQLSLCLAFTQFGLHIGTLVWCGCQQIFPNDQISLGNIYLSIYLQLNFLSALGGFPLVQWKLLGN